MLTLLLRFSSRKKKRKKSLSQKSTGMELSRGRRNTELGKIGAGRSWRGRLCIRLELNKEKTMQGRAWGTSKDQGRRRGTSHQGGSRCKEAVINRRKPNNSLKMDAQQLKRKRTPETTKKRQPTMELIFNHNKATEAAEA